MWIEIGIFARKAKVGSSIVYLFRVEGFSLPEAGSSLSTHLYHPYK
jgi:hypothetical protein